MSILSDHYVTLLGAQGLRTCHISFMSLCVSVLLEVEEDLGGNSHKASLVPENPSENIQVYLLIFPSITFSLSTC